MSITHVNTQSATQGNATSVTVTKPTGLATDDVMVAFFVSNDQNCTAPAGWTELSDDSISTFRCQLFYKVAGGSEPANYAFSVAAAAPLVCQISAWRGVDTSDVLDADVVTAANEALAEQAHTPIVTASASGRLIYHRAVRFVGSTVPTFTASGVTEISDTGVFSGGSVSYSSAIYSATSDYTTGGSKSGLATTCSQAESHNLLMTFGLKASGVPGTMSVTLPSLPSVSVSGAVAVPGTMGATLPLLGPVSIDAYHGSYEGSLAAQVPVSMDFQGFTEPRGPMDVLVTPVVSFLGETRYFSDNVVNVAREDRWMILTQDDMRPGIRDLRLSALAVELPQIEIDFDLLRGATPTEVTTSVAVNQPRVSITSPLAVSAVANNAVPLPGALAQAQHVSVTCHN